MLKRTVAALLLLSPMTQAQVLNIADAKGDWGLLAPFAHDARGPGFVYTSLVFDSLLWKDSDGTLQPMLAKSWSYQGESGCYQFTLDSNAKWHDNQPVTAADVRFSFEYMREHRYRFVDLSPVKTVVADGGQVEVCLYQPHAPFLLNVAATLPILPEHLYQQIEDPTRFNQIVAATGSGPYRLEQYNRAQSQYRLLRNDSYHLGKPRFSEIRLVRMSPPAALPAMQRGQIDLTVVPHELADSYQQAGLALVRQQSNHPFRLLFNHQAGFDSVALRQGIARLLDRQQLVDIVYQDHAEVARVAYRQDSVHPLPDNYQPDAARATSQLAQAGWQKTPQGQWLDANGTVVRLSILAQTGGDLLVRAVAEQLEKQGIAVDVRLEQDVQLAERLRQGEFDLALLSASHEGDPDRFRLLINGQQQRSDHYLANPELLALLEQQVRTLDETGRDELLHQAEVIYHHDLPSLPLVNPASFAAYNADKLQVRFTPGGACGWTVFGMQRCRYWCCPCTVPCSISIWHGG